MKEYFFDSFRVLSSETDPADLPLSFAGEPADAALRFHRSLPVYRESPLVSLSCAAEQFRVDSIFVKDESARFGLKAFKGLGGSYCMFRVLCSRLGLDVAVSDYTTFLRDDIRRACAETVFVTATDGNHGKGISWAAGQFGCRAHVFLPRGSAEARRKAIEEAGSATAEITDLNYDQTVQYAADLAEKNGWILIQDTSWPGYEIVPRWIIDGYLTMAAEAADQMGDKFPTHIFLQAGVGAMAGGVASYFLHRFRDNRPLLTIAEPKEAACLYHSVRAGDGRIHSIGGDPITIMAGLNCGTPCGITWPVLRDGVSLFCSCEDTVAVRGMRAYARPHGADRPVISGESGSVTYGLLLSILESERLRDLFRIGQDSVILLFNTEGDTDPDGYRAIIGG